MVTAEEIKTALTDKLEKVGNKKENGPNGLKIKNILQEKLNLTKFPYIIKKTAPKPVNDDKDGSKLIGKESAEEKVGHEQNIVTNNVNFGKIQPVGICPPTRQRPKTLALPGEIVRQVLGGPQVPRERHVRLQKTT